MAPDALRLHFEAALLVQAGRKLQKRNE